MTQSEQIEYLKTKGWIFDEETYTHPHCNSVQTSFMFRSPRMKQRAYYTYVCDLLELESDAIARYNLRHDDDMNFFIHRTVFDELAAYYRKNPDSTKIPKLKLEIQ